MGSNIAGMFPAQQVNPYWSGNPATQPFQAQLGNTFQNYLSQYGANLPGYQGNLTADQTPQMSMANKMFESAIGSYDPARFNDIYSKYSGIASGQGPNLQAYMDAVSKKAGNEWQQNVMPSVIEKTRGYGRGSVTPESIANSGSTYYQNLAGTMAPYMLQAGQGDIQNRLAAMGGMGNTATSMAQLPLNQATQFGQWGLSNQQQAQDATMRNYDEFKRQSMGMLPYMLQFAGGSGGGNVTPSMQPNQAGQIAGNAVNTALQLWALMR